MKKLLFASALLALACASFGQAAGDADEWNSLYPKNAKNPFVDRTACNVGDILTIVINDSVSATFTANTAASKKDDNSIGQTIFPLLGSLSLGFVDKLAGFLGLNRATHTPTTSTATQPASLVNQLLAPASTSATSSNSGQGQTSQSSKFTAKISVTVKSVLPNGNMVVEGSRIVKVNKDFQIFKFSGIVRKDDVKRDNTVPSEAVANVDIQTDGKGLIGDRQRKGILTKILDWMF